MVSCEPQSGQRLPEVGLRGVMLLIFIMLSSCCWLMWFSPKSGYHFSDEPEMRQRLKKIRAGQHAGEIPVWFERFRVKRNGVNGAQRKNSYLPDMFTRQKPLTSAENQPVGGKAATAAPVGQQSNPPLF